jgi:hypothetical protein
MAGVVAGGLKVGLNGTKEAVKRIDLNVGDIADTQTAHGLSIATLEERTTAHAADIDRLESRIE